MKKQNNNLYNIKSLIETCQPYLITYYNLTKKDFDVINSIINISIANYKSTIKKYQSKLAKDKQVSTKSNDKDLLNTIKDVYHDEILDDYE